MKVIILTAGSGARLNYGKPKSLVDIDHRKLLDIQLSQLKLAGISLDDVVVITGYKSKLFNEYNLKKIKNIKYKKTNQVFSISRASNYSNEQKVLIIYGDVLFEAPLITNLLNSEHEVIVPSYTSFKKLWKIRGDSKFEDLETFEFNDSLTLTHIGNKVKDIDLVQGQFMGLIYMNNYKFKMFLDNYKLFKVEKNYKEYLELQTTTFLNYLIRNSVQINIMPYDGYFMELDSRGDLEIIQQTLSF